MTSKWTERSLNIVKRCFSYDEEEVILSESKNFESTVHKISEKAKMIISYNYSAKLYVAWDASIHGKLHKKQFRMTAGRDARMILRKRQVDSNTMIALYVHRDNSYHVSGFEKVMLLGDDKLYDFCKNYECLMLPNPTDEYFKGPCLASFGNDLTLLDNDNFYKKYAYVRQHDLVMRQRRDSEFRSKILSKYHNTCIICGSKEIRILQAAHIEGVKNGGDDSPGNGICLCANHHLLYDNGLLNIDLKNNTFECLSESEQSMPWYKEAQKRNFQLYL